MARGTSAGALWIAREGLKHHPDASSLLLLEARALLEEFHSAGTTDQDAPLRAKTMERLAACCRKLIEAQHYDQAAALATRALELSERDSRFALLHCRALIGAARYQEAEAATTSYLRTFPTQLRLRTFRCRCLFELGRYKEAADLAARILEVQPDDAMLQLLLCRALLEYGDLETAEQQADAALSSRPDDVALLTVRGRALLEQGRGGEFCTCLAPSAIPSGGRTTALWNVYARSLEQAGRWQEVVDWLEPVTRSGKTVTPGVYEALSSAYNRLGLADKAKQTYKELASLLSAIVPDDLATGLVKARSAGPMNLPNPTLTGHLLDRLWELADHERWSRTDWTERLCWGGGAQRILRNLMMVQPDRMEEIVALTDYGDMTAFEEIIARGQPCLLTGGHYGAYAAVVAMLVHRKIPTCVLSKYAIPPEFLPENFVCVTAASHPRIFLRSLQQAISEGRAIAVSGDIDTDLGSADKGYRLSLYGQEIDVAALPTRLAYQFGLPTLWLESLFEGERITMSSKTLATSPDNETKEAFAERWWVAYLTEMTRVLSTDPANLYFETGPVRRALLERDHRCSAGPALRVEVPWPAGTPVGVSGSAA